METKGFDELEKALRYLPDEMQQKCIEQALKHAGKAVVEQARANIRSRSGALARAITLRTNRKQGTNCLVQLGPFRKTMFWKGKFSKPFYGHMIEWGTKAHHIPLPGKYRKEKKALLIPGSGHPIYEVDVSGIAGQRPFARAMDERRTEFIWRFGDYVDKFITKHFRKWASNTARSSSA